MHRKYRLSTVLISLLTKTAQKENSWNRLSGLNAADTSKRGAWLWNDICEYLWFKKTLQGLLKSILLV